MYISDENTACSSDDLALRNLARSDRIAKETGIKHVKGGKLTLVENVRSVLL